MPQNFLIGKQSLLKVESTRNYTKENKVQLSVDSDILRNKNYNKFDVSKDPLSAFIANTAVSTFNQSIDTSIPIVYSSMSLYLDASNPSSYPGSGNTWYDLSVYGNNFTLSNSPTYSSNFLKFETNQSATCINTTCGNFYTGSFTIEYITYYTGSNGGSTDALALKRSTIFSIAAAGFPGWAFRIAGSPQAWLVQDDNPGSTSNNFTNALGTTGAPPKVTSTVHMAYVIQKNGYSTTGSVYTNGALTFTDKKKFIGTNSTDNSAAMTIASNFTGSISVVRTYSRALSSVEVLQNFNSTKNKYGL